MGLDDHGTINFRKNYRLVFLCFELLSVHCLCLLFENESRTSPRLIMYTKASDSDSGTSVTLVPYDRKHVESSLMEPKAKKKKPYPGKGQHVMTTFFKSTQAVNSGCTLNVKRNL